MVKEIKKQLNKDLKTEIQELEKENKILKDELSGVMELFDGIGDGIAYIDKHKRIIRVNKALLEIGGYKKEDIVGKKLATLALRGIISPKSLPKAIKAFAKRMKGEKYPPYDVVLATKDGIKIDVEVHAAPLKRNNKIIGTVAVLRDIGTRKGIKETLKKKNESLEMLNKAMIGRELKMIELKEKVKRLEKRLEEGS